MHRFPPFLGAAITYAVDQPPIGTVEAAIDVARTMLHIDDAGGRELSRANFIRREARDGAEMERMTDDEHTAALVA